MNKIVNDAWGRVLHWVRNEFDFTYNGINYEKDRDSGRCYRLEASISLRPEMDGTLVRRRISGADYWELFTLAAIQTGYKNS